MMSVLLFLGLSLAVPVAGALAMIPTDGLVSFWDFQERSGPFVAKLGRGRYVFEEKSFDPSTHVWSSNNKVQRVQDAPPARPFGDLSASIGMSQMLHVPDTYETAPLLNIYGDNATLTVVAWVSLWSERVAVPTATSSMVLTTGKHLSYSYMKTEEYIRQTHSSSVGVIPWVAAPRP